MVVGTRGIEGQRALDGRAGVTVPTRRSGYHSEQEMRVRVPGRARQHLETGGARARAIRAVQPLQGFAMPAFDFPFRRDRPVRRRYIR
jgi:hypothetical protein